MPNMIRKYSNKTIYAIYQVFLSLLLLLVGAVFIYTPGDLAATQIFGFDGKATSVSTWVIYGVIFAYYLLATVLPIDAIIGRIYPIFGLVLLFSAIGVFIGMFLKGYPLIELWDAWDSPMAYQVIEGVEQHFSYADYFTANRFIPIFFITVACGLLSGFHSSQTAIITRTMKSERGSLILCAIPIRLENFFVQDAWSRPIPTIFTSGTMSVRGDFTYFKEKFALSNIENFNILTYTVWQKYRAFSFYRPSFHPSTASLCRVFP